MEPILSVKDLSVSFNAFAGKVHAVRDVNFDLYKGETLAGRIRKGEKSMEPILSVKDLSVSFNAFAGKVHAVRDVNFDLYKGETLAIVGESGSGKSVTTKAILGILAKNGHIDSGTIMYQGQDMAKYKEADFYKIRGKRISLVFQDPLSALNPIMKIGKQITEALILSKAIEKSKAKARAIELIETLGIPNAAERYDAYPFQFSGGMRQRIVIASALASNPEILICDEPTTALDVTIQARILELINDMKRERDLSVIFITHYLGVVANMADLTCIRARPWPLWGSPVRENP